MRVWGESGYFVGEGDHKAINHNYYSISCCFLSMEAMMGVE